MRRMLETAMRQYGTDMKVSCDGKVISVRAFLQPSRSKARQETQMEYSPLGQIPMEQYVYIGPAEPVVKDGDLVEAAGVWYRMHRTEPVYAGGGILYYWALCRKKGGDEA